MSDFQKKLGDLKGFVEESIKHWNVPGVALSIVKDGEVVLAEGFGFKDLENKKPMTADTIMPIGSTTKSFTSMAAAILVEEGKLDWDAPVNEYIPNFKMFDPVASRLISVRDMLCHRGGMPRHDLMWAGGTGEAFTREDLVKRVRHLENNAQFREKAQYQNHMFATVGHVIENITKKSWEDFVKEKILKPLGMKDSNFQVSESQKAPDHGLPYRHDKENKITRAEFMELGAPGPAGSINSTANDMTNWMKLVLANGTFGETKIVSEEKLKEMQKPHMHYGIMPFEFPEVMFPSVGLGWFTDVYRGKKITHHGGNVSGFTALCAFLPDENLGICALVNMNSSFLTYALRNEIFDRALGISGGDWNKRYKDEIDKMIAEMEKGKKEAANAKVENTKPTLELDKYLGEFLHPGYGKIIVEKNEETGWFNGIFNGRALPLNHFNYDHFSLNLPTFDTDIPAKFALGRKGDVESIAVMFEAAIGKEIVFTRKEEPKEESKEEKDGK